MAQSGTVGALVSAIVTLGLAAGANAQLPRTERVEVGRPRAPISLELAATESGASIRLRGRGTPREVAIELGAPATEIAIEPVDLAQGGRVVVVRARADGREGAALVSARGGAPRILFEGRLDAHGDPGERRRDVIALDDRTGDGVADAIVGIDLETHRVCGLPQALVSPRAVDPASHELRPITLRQIPAHAEVEVRAASVSPGPLGPPLLAALAWRSASSTRGTGADPSLASPPTALSDGDLGRGWAAGRADTGRFEFATAAWTGPGPIQGFAISLPPATAGLSRPSHVWLVGDAPPRLHVAIPSDAAAGERLFVTPPAPLAWHCVSVVLDDAVQASGAMAIGEVEAYSELDFGRGVDALIVQIVADDDAGDRAADVLRRLGTVGVSAVLEAWPTLTATGKRRAIRVLAVAPSGAAFDAIASAAADDDETLRDAALRALVAAGEPGVAALGRLAAAPTPAGERAAEVLAGASPDTAAEALLAAVTVEGGAARPGLRRAIRDVARASAPARDAVARWAAAGPSIAAAASVALALGTVEGAHAPAVALLDASVARAEAFEDRFRLVAASAALGAGEPVDGWLAAQVASAEEWMLRAAALEALAARRSPRVRDVASAALEDDYPRVRAAAARALGGAPETLRAVATVAARDRWPLVRAIALEAIATADGAGPLVRRSLDDDSQGVRAAALRGLVARRDRTAAAAVAARLSDDGEWPEVLAEAIRYASDLCVPELMDPLAALVRRGMRPDAWEPDIDTAVLALEAAARLGGPDAAALLSSASSETAPGALRAAASHARQNVEQCTPR